MTDDVSSLNINGIVINEADFRYLNDAQSKGYEVWGLFNNSFKIFTINRGSCR